MAELTQRRLPLHLCPGARPGADAQEHAVNSWLSGRIRREFRDVYVDARVPDSRNGRLRAIGLVNPAGAIACNETAAWLHGIDVFTPGGRHELRTIVRRRALQGAGRSTRRLRTAGDHHGRGHRLRRWRVRHDAVAHGVGPAAGLYRPYALAAADAFAHAGLIDAGRSRRVRGPSQGIPRDRPGSQPRPADRATLAVPRRVVAAAAHARRRLPTAGAAIRGRGRSLAARSSWICRTRSC